MTSSWQCLELEPHCAWLETEQFASQQHRVLPCIAGHDTLKVFKLAPLLNHGDQHAAHLQLSGRSFRQLARRRAQLPFRHTPAEDSVCTSTCHLDCHEMIEVVRLEQYRTILCVQESEDHVCESLIGSCCHHHFTLHPTVRSVLHTDLQL